MSSLCIYDQKDVYTRENAKHKNGMCAFNVQVSHLKCATDLQGKGTFLKQL